MSLILNPQAWDNVTGLIMNLLNEDYQIQEASHAKGRFTLLRSVYSESSLPHPHSKNQRNDLFNQVFFIFPTSGLN